MSDLSSNPKADDAMLAEIRSRDSRYQLERWSNWVAHDRRWLLGYISRLEATRTSDEPATTLTHCPFCDRPASDLDGSIWHAAGCEGLQDAGLNKLQHFMLKARTAQPPKAGRYHVELNHCGHCAADFHVTDGDIDVASEKNALALATLINGTTPYRASETKPLVRGFP